MTTTLPGHSSGTSALTGRVAVVTGGASGVGEALVRALAGAGATVWVADVLSPVESTEVEFAEVEFAGLGADALESEGDGTSGAEQTSVPTSGSRVVERHCDVSDPADISGFVELVREREGRIDILVNNAGVMRRSGPFDDWTRSLEDFENLVNVNLRGPFLFGRAVAPLMVAGGGGDIIMMSTDHVHTCGWPEQVEHRPDSTCPWKDAPRPTGATGMDVYDASKWALHGLTQDWAKELGGHGIRVNNICLGATDSAMIRSFAGYADTEPPAEVLAAWQRPDEVAAVVLELILEGSGGRSGDNIGLWRGHPTVLPPADPVLDVSGSDLSGHAATAD